MFKLMFTFDDFISRFWGKKQLLDTNLAAKSQFYTRSQETDIVNIFVVVFILRMFVY